MNQHARVDAAPIPFIDLAAQRRRLGRRGSTRRSPACSTHCQFILGPEVRALEAELAAFCGARHAISCASGTDALLLVLMAKGIGPGDAVICPAFTFCATAEVVALLGATPVFADVDEATFNIDPASLERAIATAKRLGLTPKAVIPVDLFGLPADHDALKRCRRRGITFRARRCGAGVRRDLPGPSARRAGAATATSFFPAKPLGCYGDGGAVLTDDDGLAEIMRKACACTARAPTNTTTCASASPARLDTIQAAVLLEKLKIFPDEIAARQRIAARYAANGLGNLAIVPRVPDGFSSVWAQYTIRLAPGRRATASPPRSRPRASRPRSTIPSRCTARRPMRDYPVADGGVLPVSDRLADEVISLPMHAYLDEPTQDRIIEAVRGAEPLNPGSVETPSDRACRGLRCFWGASATREAIVEARSFRVRNGRRFSPQEDDQVSTGQ